MSAGQVNETSIVNVEHRAREHDEGARARFDHRRKRAVEIIWALSAENLKFDSARFGAVFHLLQHVLHRAFAIYGRMLKHRDSSDSGDDLSQQLPAFAP